MLIDKEGKRKYNKYLLRQEVASLQQEYAQTTSRLSQLDYARAKLGMLHSSTRHRCADLSLVGEKLNGNSETLRQKLAATSNEVCFRCYYVIPTILSRLSLSPNLSRLFRFVTPFSLPFTYLVTGEKIAEKC